MYRALIGLFLCAGPALAQFGYFRPSPIVGEPPRPTFMSAARAAGEVRPSDGLVLTREHQWAFLNRVYEAYRNLPDDLTFVNDELRVERAIRPANGVWVVVEMTLDGRRLPLSEFDGL